MMPPEMLGVGIVFGFGFGFEQVARCKMQDARSKKQGACGAAECLRCCRKKSELDGVSVKGLWQSKQGREKREEEGKSKKEREKVRSVRGQKDGGRAPRREESGGKERRRK